MKTAVRIISPILLLAVMIGIFCLSDQEASRSSELSGGFTYKMFCVFYPDFKDKSANEQQKIIENFSFPVRKTAHFTIYFALGAFAFLSIATYNVFSLYVRGIISWVFCILYSVSDEIHQYYVPGRSCELRDVLIDSLGQLLAIALLVLIFKRISSRKKEG